jgi:hypothetical protein
METAMDAVKIKDERQPRFSTTSIKKLVIRKKYLAFALLCLLLSVAPAAAARFFIDEYTIYPAPAPSQSFEGEWARSQPVVYTPPTALVFAAALSGPIFYWTGWTVFLFVGGMLLGGRSSFRVMFRATLIAWGPFALRGMLQSVYIALSGSPIANSGLSGFGVEAGEGEWYASFLIHILSHIDIYLPAHLVLLVYFGGRAGGLSRKNTLKLVLAGVLLLALLTFLPDLLSSMIADWTSNSSF